MKSVMMVMMGLLILISGVFAYQGVSMHGRVLNEEARFHELQAEYFNMAKSERDAAVSGSTLNQNLVAINQYPSELLRLKLVGVGKILTGIYVLLFGILIALIMMPIKLGMIIKSKK